MLKIKLKAFLLILLTMLLMCIFTSSVPASDGRFYSQEGKFKVAFDGEPTIMQKDININGQTTLFAYGCQTNESNCFVMFAGFPEQQNKIEDINAFRTALRDNFIKIFKCQIISEMITIVNGFDGTEYIASNGKDFIKMITVTTDKRIYTFFVQTDLEHINSQKTNDFLNSFEIVPE